MYVDTGGADTSGLFPHYEASPDAIETSAEGLDRHAANIQAFSTEIDAQHQMAVASVSGVIAEPLSTAAQTPHGYSTLLMGSTYISSGSIRLFGQGVQRFNQTIEQLNEQYRQALASEFGVAETTYPEKATVAQKNEIDGARDDEIMDARVALLRSLVEQYLGARDVLDGEAETSAAQINAGPTDEVLQNLYGAGVLPSSVTLAYPNLGLTTTVLPPDLAELDPADVEEYLRSHPEVADSVVNGLLTKDGLTDLEQAFVEAQARIDGELLKEGMGKPPGQEALDDIAAAQARLQLVADHVAQTGVLNDAAHSYTFAWMNEVGSDNLAKLPQVVSDSVYATMHGLSVTQADLDQYLTPVANAIMTLSEQDYQPVDVSSEGAGYVETLRYDLNGDGIIDKNDLPKAVRDLMSMRIGEYNGGVRSGGPFHEPTGAPTYDTITNLDNVTGWAELISSATVQGGDHFSVDLAEQAIQAKQDMNAILGEARHQVSQMTDGEEVWAELTAKLDDSASSNLLSAAALNEDASSELLLDDARRQQILGLNWDNGQGAGDVIRAGTDRDPANGGGTGLQADAAMTVMSEIASDPKEYMERAANESVSDAVVDMGITWIDTFGKNVSTDTNTHYESDTTDAIGRPLDFSLTLSDADQQGFLQFVANTGDEDAIRFEATSQLYSQQLISAALDGNYEIDPDFIEDADVDPRQAAMEGALAWAGRADGQIHQANIQWALDELGDDQAKERAELIAENRSVASTKTAVKTMLSIGGTIAGSAFPPAAPFISVGNAIAGPIIDGALQESPMPDFEAISEERASELIVADSLDSESRRDYLLAQVALARGETVPASLLNEDGTLRPLAEVANIDKGLDKLGYVSTDLVDDWNTEHHANADITRYDDVRQATNPPIPPGDRSSGNRSRDWDDDQVAEENLYGDNVPEGYSTGDVNPEDSAQETYADENYQVDQAPWEKRTNDETTNDRREKQHRRTNF